MNKEHIAVTVEYFTSRPELMNHVFQMGKVGKRQSFTDVSICLTFSAKC